VVRQNAVLDGTKQRRDGAEDGESREKERQSVQPEARCRKPRGADLGELEATGNQSLVEAVGHLAAEP
jgi:hypothetical protein